MEHLGQHQIHYLLEAGTLVVVEHKLLDWLLVVFHHQVIKIEQKNTMELLGLQVEI